MTVLADSSAWVEFLRRTGSQLDLAMRRRLAAGEVATTDVVLMEVLAGATPTTRLAGIERALAACDYRAQRQRTDAHAAAELYRQCRRGGKTPRQLTDCLVAAVALRSGMAVLQRDHDFDVLAECTALEVVTQ